MSERIAPNPTPKRISHCEQRVDRAFRRSLVVIAALAVVVAVAATWLNLPASSAVIKQTQTALPETRHAPVAQLPTAIFTDVTREAGITFVHENGARGEKLLPETMGGGCALFDYDDDGDLDILLVNSMRWPEAGDLVADTAVADTAVADTATSDGPATETAATMALYQNQGNWEFADVTKAAGLAVPFFGMGVAVGDFDNDGDRDVFVTAVGPNRLFRNDGGVFVDVSAEAGVGGSPRQWSSGCAWLDYNNDGRLDLFVCNYIHWSREMDLAQHFSLDGSTRAYGPPLAFEGAFAYVYRNDGDGRFTDVSEQVGVQVANPATQVPMAKALGLAPVDLDRDGWIDVVIANDTVQNFVFHNEQGERFREVGAITGVAFDSFGHARGAMGIDAARFRNDSTMGVAVGNFANEMTALYVSVDDPMQFFDASIATGLGPPTRLELTFGVFFFDYDLDGRLDLLAANGHLEEEIQKVQESQRYAQPPQLFWNGGVQREPEFVRVPSEKCGPDLHKPMVGRGSAFGDLDGDGDLDLLIAASGQRPRLLRNDQQIGHHWIKFRLRGTQCNRDALGGWLEVHAGEQVFPRQVTRTRGYLSQSELAVTVGLGDLATVDNVVVHWPGGATETISNPAVDQMHVIQQKGGRLNAASKKGEPLMDANNR